MSTTTRRRIPTKPRGFRSIASTTMNQDGIDHTKLPAGATPPQVVVTQLIDEDGAHWQREGGGKYEFIGWAPEVPDLPKP